jgi:hypothetical protein
MAPNITKIEENRQSMPLKEEKQPMKQFYKKTHVYLV